MGGTPRVGERTIGTKAAVSFNGLGEDQDLIDDWEEPNVADPPLPYPEGLLLPPTAVGSG